MTESDSIKKTERHPRLAGLNPQGTTPMSPENQILSRRAIVAGAVAAPALALPVVPALAAANPDAELLALGEQFELIIRDWAAQRVFDRNWSAAVDAETERVTGIAKCHAPKPHIDNFDTGYWAEQRRISSEIPGGEESDSAWDDINERLNPLAHEIISHKAQTIAGLAVQARAMTVYYPLLWDADDEDEYEHHRNFIESVCSFVGLTPLPLTVPVRD
jgi:hypothetical protein